ncbi:jacalin-like lectin [Caldilinea sp.]|uniref:jacalin-like lectin n=1 Tax=Caldilinea sp. TaxID=2293560 RepID=UPI002C46817C|nr:hypothetical protein [Anaerolineales bacterium]HQY89975.1 jacalin-like lectin [Caldilinea sp.]HRA67514.1 jacalin-like lectin [Caldilinea sp.]
MEDGKLGPSGGNGGLPLQGVVIPAGARISEVRVTCGWFVDSIQIGYTDAAGESHMLPGVGGHGSHAHQFALEAGEYLVGISGRSGRYVDSIVFHTNLRVSPTYGGGSGEHAFSFLAPEDSEVVGFFGSADWYIDAIGILTRGRPDAVAQGAQAQRTAESVAAVEAPAKPAKRAKKAAVVAADADAAEPAVAAPAKPARKTKPSPAAVEAPARPAASPRQDEAVAPAVATPAKPARKAKPSPAAVEAPAEPASPPVETRQAAVVATDMPSDNLELIEGIGPKIAEVLAQHGIATFAVLANTPAERLREILLGAGRRFAVADPASWPSQATLAAKGDMNALKLLQSSLKGGRAK